MDPESIRQWATGAADAAERYDSIAERAEQHAVHASDTADKYRAIAAHARQLAELVEHAQSGSRKSAESAAARQSDTPTPEYDSNGKRVSPGSGSPAPGSGSLAQSLTGDDGITPKVN